MVRILIVTYILQHTFERISDHMNGLLHGRFFLTKTITQPVTLRLVRELRTMR